MRDGIQLPSAVYAPQSVLFLHFECRPKILPHVVFSHRQ